MSGDNIQFYPQSTARGYHQSQAHPTQSSLAPSLRRIPSASKNVLTNYHQAPQAYFDHYSQTAAALGASFGQHSSSHSGSSSPHPSMPVSPQHNGNNGSHSTTPRGNSNTYHRLADFTDGYFPSNTSSNNDMDFDGRESVGSCGDNSSNSSVIGYSWNPYDSHTGLHLYHKQVSILPQGTLHASLENYVTFVPYPNEPFHAEPAKIEKDAMMRVFIGQLPYQVTDMQLEWLCYLFGNGKCVYYPERIMKRETEHHHHHHHSPNAVQKVPTGCIHAYCDPSFLADLTEGMHKRILVDDTGVWYAQTSEEAAYLNNYCQQLKLDKRLRFQNRPYDTVVVQQATSSHPGASHPTTTASFVSHNVSPQQGSSRSSATTTPQARRCW